MMEYEAHVSDGHFGAQKRATYIEEAVTALVQKLQSLAGECHERIRIVINGDLIAGPYQRGDADDLRARLYPRDWEDILREQTAPLFDYLRHTQMRVEYLMGNSERREDMEKDVLERRFGPNIHWGERTGTYAYYNNQERRMVTHMHLAEPGLSILQRSARSELAGLLLPSLRDRGYAKQDRSDAWRAHLSDAHRRLFAAACDCEREEFLDAASIDIDDVHKESCLKNAKVDRLLSVVPRFVRSWKNAFVSRTLNRVYVRTIAALHGRSDEVQSFSFGHIHDPFIFAREQIAKRLGIEPGDGLKFIVNSGTMIPLTAAHGGDHRAHMLFWRGSEPELHRTFDLRHPSAAPRLVNIGGQTLSGRV